MTIGNSRPFIWGAAILLVVALLRGSAILADELNDDEAKAAARVKKPTVREMKPATVDEVSEETPIGKRWFPSKWGPNDQRGAANLLTPEKVLEAKQLIRTGQIYSLGFTYEFGIPIPPGKRHFSLTIPGSPTGGPYGKNMMVYHDDLFSGELGQIGTQFDGLGHIGVRIGREDYFYNGWKRSQFGTPYGLMRLGVENVGPIFTRGILLDVAGLRKTNRLPIGHVVTVNELQACLDQTKLKIGSGDVVLIRTGHASLWMKDNELFNSGEPGIGMEAAKFLSGLGVVMIGVDNWAIEVIPHEDPDRPFPVHQWNLVRHGIYHLENMNLEALAKDRVYEFAFVFTPLPMKGATGSPGNPIAVR